MPYVKNYDFLDKNNWPGFASSNEEFDYGRQLAEKTTDTMLRVINRLEREKKLSELKDMIIKNLKAASKYKEDIQANENLYAGWKSFSDDEHKEAA